MIDLLYFSWVRERIGKGGEQVELPPGVTTVAALLDLLEARGGTYGAALGERDRLRVAVNQAFAPLDGPVRAGDEVAIFPPVTGG
jgi:molybdopterin synthase sulfur carrier subunit